MKRSALALAVIGATIFTNVSAVPVDKVEIADPTIFWDGKQYLMFGTEAPPQQGIPVLSSSDLTHWQPISGKVQSYALHKDHSTFGDRGFWAPQVLKHDDQYLMAYTANEKIAIATSPNAQGLFQQKHQSSIDNNTRQIDPFVFFDDDGKAYLYHVRLNKGNHIWVAELTSDLSQIKPETLKKCLSVKPKTWEHTLLHRGKVVEGPTVLKHKETYYLIYSANHFKSDDYAVGYATAPTPFGPWTRSENSPIIHRSIVKGFDGTGHGDFFYDQNQTLRYVFHAHASKQQVHPRQTLIVEAEFVANQNGPDKLRIKPETLISPVLEER